MFRRRHAKWEMVPAAPLVRYLQLPGWEPIAAYDGRPVGRFDCVPEHSTGRRRLWDARTSGWISEQAADDILTWYFGDGHLVQEWWGEKSLPPSPLRKPLPRCGVCGDEMLEPAEACGFCLLESAAA